MFLAPFRPMPHVIEKFIMLKNGTLTKPIDIFDLFFHLVPTIILLLKVYKDYSKSWKHITIFQNERTFIQLQRMNHITAEQLNNIYVKGPVGSLVPLGTIARVENRTVSWSINRFQQFNAVKISGVPIRPLNQALGFLEDEAAKILPKGYVIDYTGESRQLRTEGNKFLPAFMLALVMIFLTLSAQYNSFRDPFVILAGSVPLAMFGALIFTFLRMPDPNVPFWTNSWTTTLNIYSQVGLVTLIGVISKNGILIVEFANKLQLRGRTKQEAIREAGITRLRPILMTSAATIVGYFPLVIAGGAGAAARNSIGLVLVGGMTIGTAFTLFVVPVVYMLIARDHHAQVAEIDLESATHCPVHAIKDYELPEHCRLRAKG